MVKIFTRVWLLGLALSFAACQNTETATTQPILYFDLKGLLEQQQKQLSTAQVSKDALVGTNVSQAVRTEKPDWAHELHLFYEADINKPAWFGNYAIDSSHDAQGNLSVRYTTQVKTMPVKYLQIDFGANKQVKYIRSLIEERNMLYDSDKRMELFFDSAAAVPQLQKYRMSGFQKIILKDTMSYQITGNVLR
jgi:hypothetical protein